MSRRATLGWIAAALLACGAVAWLLLPNAGRFVRETARGALSGEGHRPTALLRGGPTPGSLEPLDLAPEAGSEGREAPGSTDSTTGGSSETPPPEGAAGGESSRVGGAGSRRAPISLTDADFHERVLSRLPEDRTVSYLAVRVRKLAVDTLQLFPGDHPDRSEVRQRVMALDRRVVERKRMAAGDAEALEALRQDLLRVDAELVAWRDRVLAGEPLIPEIEF